MSSLNRLVRQATRIASSRGGGRAGRPRHGAPPRGGAHGGSTGSRLGSQVGRMIEQRLTGRGRRRP